MGGVNIGIVLQWVVSTLDRLVSWQQQRSQQSRDYGQHAGDRGDRANGNSTVGGEGTGAGEDKMLENKMQKEAKQKLVASKISRGRFLRYPNYSNGHQYCSIV